LKALELTGKVHFTIEGRKIIVNPWECEWEMGSGKWGWYSPPSAIRHLSSYYSLLVWRL